MKNSLPKILFALSMVGIAFSVYSQYQEASKKQKERESILVKARQAKEAKSFESNITE